LRSIASTTRILAAIEHNLSNGLIESTDTKIRLITRMAFGFKSPQALIAVALLSLGGHRPTLPGRKKTHGYVRRASFQGHFRVWSVTLDVTSG